MSKDEREEMMTVHPDDKKRKEQVKNYRKYLKGEEVLSTFKKAIIFLNAVNNDVLFRKSKI